MAEALKNIANALKDSRVRTIVVFTCAILLVGIIITIIELRSGVVGPEIKASVGKAPAGMESIPGGFEQPETVQYANLQEKENVIRAKQAAKSGGSAIPTITGSQKLTGNEGEGADGAGQQNWQAGLGFSSLNRAQESGMAPKGLGTEGAGGTGTGGTSGIGTGGAGTGTGGTGANGAGGAGTSGAGKNGLGTSGTGTSGLGTSGLGTSGAGRAGAGGLAGTGGAGTGTGGTAGLGGQGAQGVGTNALAQSDMGLAGRAGAGGAGTSGLGGVGNAGAGGAGGATAGDNANLAAIAQRQAAQLSAAQLDQLRQQMQAGMTAQANQLLSTTWAAPTQQYVAGTPPQQQAGAKGGAGGAGGSAGGLAGGTAAGGTLFKAGTILFGILTTSVNSDEPGPVMATIVDGPYKGAKLLGAMTNQGQKVMLSFNLMSLPGSSKSISLNAVAVDQNTARTALSSDTNNHILLRYGTLFASSFIQGYGQAFSQSGQTVTTNGLQTNTTNPDLTPGGKFYVALGNVGTKWGQATANLFNRPPTVQVYAGTGVGILILADVSDTGTP